MLGRQQFDGEQESGSGDSGDARAAPRKNMYLAAILDGAEFSAPVKVRNMSSEGALIEGAVLPPPGSAVRLLRGSLLVPAVVAWTAEGRCGLRFSSVVSVRDWLAPPANREQQRIDELVRVVKAGAVPFPASNCEAASQSAELAQDLVRVSQLIERCTDDLAGDETILERHGERLMDLDIALQTMRVVSDILAGDGDQAVAGSRLENLRTSCRQAIRR